MQIVSIKVSMCNFCVLGSGYEQWASSTLIPIKCTICFFDAHHHFNWVYPQCDCQMNSTNFCLSRTIVYNASVWQWPIAVIACALFQCLFLCSVHFSVFFRRIPFFDALWRKVFVCLWFLTSHCGMEHVSESKT